MHMGLHFLRFQPELSAARDLHNRGCSLEGDLCFPSSCLPARSRETTHLPEPSYYQLYPSYCLGSSPSSLQHLQALCERRGLGEPAAHPSKGAVPLFSVCARAAREEGTVAVCGFLAQGDLEHMCEALRSSRNALR